MRLIMEHVCTLAELDTYSLDDVADLNEALDAWAEATRPKK